MTDASDTGELTPAHRALLRHLAEKTAGWNPPHEFQVATAWLGWVADGVGVWVQKLDEQAFPGPWDASDMEALAASGHLEQLSRSVKPDDPHDTDTRYRLTTKALALC
jgi:hypothetical protein